MMTAKRELMIWRLKRGARQLGWSGIAGITLLLFAAGYYVFSYAPLRDAVALQKQAFADASFELERSGHIEDVGTPARQLAQFYARLKSADQVPDAVRRLHRAARAAGLRFVRGDYRPQRDASGKLLRYQITLPVRGSYPDVRRFLAQALRDEPALALDGVAFQTGQSGAGLETRVQFTLFVRANEAGPTIDGVGEPRATLAEAQR